MANDRDARRDEIASKNQGVDKDRMQETSNMLKRVREHGSKPKEFDVQKPFSWPRKIRCAK